DLADLRARLRSVEVDPLPLPLELAVSDFTDFPNNDNSDDETGVEDVIAAAEDIVSAVEIVDDDQPDLIGDVTEDPEVITPEELLEEHAAEAAEASDEEGDEDEEFRAPVESPYDRPGQWYVIHSYSGYEKKVKSNLESRIASMNMEDRIYEVVIPEEDVPEL